MVFNREQYKNWNKIDLGNYWFRLYWMPKSGDKMGFEAICFEAQECFGETDSPFEEDGTKVIIIFKAEAMFDGVRHVWFEGEADEKGYFNYPNLEAINLALSKLKVFTVDYCKY